MAISSCEDGRCHTHGKDWEREGWERDAGDFEAERGSEFSAWQRVCILLKRVRHIPPCSGLPLTGSGWGSSMMWIC